MGGYYSFIFLEYGTSEGSQNRKNCIACTGSTLHCPMTGSTAPTTRLQIHRVYIYIFSFIATPKKCYAIPKGAGGNY